MEEITKEQLERAENLSREFEPFLKEPEEVPTEVSILVCQHLNGILEEYRADISHSPVCKCLANRVLLFFQLFFLFGRWYEKRCQKEITSLDDLWRGERDGNKI